jgi:endonuclease YncB( thermonuclease family)
VNQAHGLWRLPNTVVRLVTPPPMPSLAVFLVQVAQVHDGDTFSGELQLRYGGLTVRGRRMRLAGCNAAELGTAAAPNAAGQAAARNLRDLLRPGMYVTVGIVSETADPHGRLLVTVALPDGTDLVESLIATQWAARWDGHGTPPVPPWPRTVVP